MALIRREIENESDKLPPWARETHELISEWPKAERNPPLSHENLLRKHQSLIVDIDREIPRLAAHNEDLERRINQKNFTYNPCIRPTPLHTLALSRDKLTGLKVLQCFLLSILRESLRDRWVSSIVLWWHGLAHNEDLVFGYKEFRDRLHGQGRGTYGAPWHIEGALESELDVSNFIGRANTMGLYCHEMNVKQPYYPQRWEKAKFIYVGSDFSKAMTDRASMIHVYQCTPETPGPIIEHFNIKGMMLYIEGWAEAQIIPEVTFTPETGPQWEYINDWLTLYEQFTNIEAATNAAKQAADTAQKEARKLYQIQERLEKDYRNGASESVFLEAQEKWKVKVEESIGLDSTYEENHKALRSYDHLVQMEMFKRIGRIKKMTARRL